MGGLLLLGLLVLLSIETVQAWKARSRYCTICGRKMGVRHVEACHKAGHFSTELRLRLSWVYTLPSLSQFTY